MRCQLREERVVLPLPFLYRAQIKYALLAALVIFIVRYSIYMR